MFSKQTWEAHLALQTQDRESKARAAGGPIRVHLRGKPPQILWGDGSTGKGRDFVPGPPPDTAEYVTAVREYWTQRVSLDEKFLRECAERSSDIYRPNPLPYQAAWPKIQGRDEIDFMRQFGEQVLRPDRERLAQAQAAHDAHPDIQTAQANEAGRIERHNEDMRARATRRLDANALASELLKAD